MAIIIDSGSIESDGGIGTTATINRPANAVEGETVVVFWAVSYFCQPQNFILPEGWDIQFVQYESPTTIPAHNIAVISKTLGASEPASYEFSYEPETEASTPDYVYAYAAVRLHGAVAGNHIVPEIANHNTITIFEDVEATYTITGFSDLPDDDYFVLFAGLKRWFTGFDQPTLFNIETAGFSSEQVQEAVGATFTMHLALWSQDTTVNGTVLPDVVYSGGDDGQNERHVTTWVAFREVEVPAEQPSLVPWTPGADNFQDPVTPEYTSQKNITEVRQDPRNGHILMIQGGLGSFGEVPATTQKVLLSTDCGKTFTQVADLGEHLTPFWDDANPDTWYDRALDTVQGIIYGENPGEWYLFTAFMNVIFTDDDGATWSQEEYALSAPIPFDEWTVEAGNEGEDLYTCLIGLNGMFDTRFQPLDIQGSTIGGLFMTEDWNFENFDALGVFRSDGAGGWEIVLDPLEEDNGGIGFEYTRGRQMPVYAAGNERWIFIMDYKQTWDFLPGQFSAGTRMDDPRNVLINDSPDLDPTAWLEKSWTISDEWLGDIFQGLELPWVDEGASWENYRAWISPEITQSGIHRLKFIPQDNHPVGGRWWLMGQILLYSDNNGDTWHNTLCDHRRPRPRMHPFFSWRRLDESSFVTLPHVLDIQSAPNNQGHLMAVGVTYDRDYLTNPLAVFAMSVDGGDTWGPVGQLPLSLANIQSGAGGPGGESPAVARHLFVCP